MSEQSELNSNEMQDLLQFLYSCPVGLVSFAEDGTVNQINPEAVNLIVKTWSVMDLGNVKTALCDVWPDLVNVIGSRPGRPGRLIENYRLIGGTAEVPNALSMTVVRVSTTQYMLAIVDDTANLIIETALRQSDNRLQALFDSIDEGYCLCEMITADGKPIDYRFLKINPSFEEMTGLVNPVGKTALELVPGLEQEWIDTYARSAFLRESVRFEQGSEAMGRWFDVFATPVEPLGHFAIVFKDQTSRRQAEQALQRTASTNAFRASLIDALRSRQPAVELQVKAVRLLRDYLDTDRVLYVEVGEKGEIDVSRAQHCRSGVSALAGCFRLDWQGPELTTDFHSGTTIVVSNVNDDPRLSDQTRLALKEINFGSYVMVPLLRNHRMMATMVTHRNEPHEWTTDEVDVIQETAQRTMLAVEQTNEDLARALRYERAELMADMLSTMEAMQSLDDQAQHLANALVPRFADYATIEVPGADPVILGAAHRDSDRLVTLSELRRMFRIADNAANFVARAAAGEAQLMRYISPQVRAEYALNSRAAELLDHLAPRSYMAVPVNLGGGVRGALTVGISDPDRALFEHDDLLFLQDAATRGGVVLAATRLRHEEHKISVRLQQALLPDQVVWHRNVFIEARYSAASAYMEVGGDWYDTFRWPNGKIGLLVGDVVGHSLESAAQMGRLRAGTAAMAPSTGSSPAALLDALQGLARGPGGTEFATACCAVIDPESGELTYSSAGHLPAIVIAPDGRVQRLDGALTAPMCAIEVGPRPERSLLIQPDSLVLLYSDGLIERRGEGIDNAVNRLEMAAVALFDAPIDEFADQLITAMVGQSPPEDDIVVVCFRFDPMRAEFHRSLPTRLEKVRELRSDLSEWLTQHHTDSDSHSDVLLAVTEACTNAIERAYLNASTGNVIVDVSSHHRHLVLSVADQGKCLSTPSQNQDRGRGIAIMRSVSKRFMRTTDANGTTVEMVFAKAALSPTPGKKIAAAGHLYGT